MKVPTYGNCSFCGSTCIQDEHGWWRRQGGVCCGVRERIEDRVGAPHDVVPPDMSDLAAVSLWLAT